MMSEIIKGTCGNCGGPIAMPREWYGITPPVPSFYRCVAPKDYPYGPVVPMSEPTISDILHSGNKK